MHMNSALKHVFSMQLQQGWQTYGFAVLSLLLVSLIGVGIKTIFPLSPENLVMLYLIAVVVTALRSGFIPAAFVSVMSVLAFNFFFVPPQLTLHVDDAQYLITFAALLLTGLVISNLAAQAKLAAENAQRREQATARLYSLSRELSTIIDEKLIARTILNHLSQSFDAEGVLYLNKQEGISEIYKSSFESLQVKENEVIQWVAQWGQNAGKGCQDFDHAFGRYFPLKTVDNCIGVLGILRDEPLTKEQENFAQAFSAQAALALEASQLAEKAKQAELLREKEKLQTILLNSVSHDLRTPLVSITGALTSLKDTASLRYDEAQRDLLEGAYEEAERLNRLVGNLLDISRLQAGSLHLKRELYDITEIIGVARAQLAPLLKRRDLHIQLMPNLPFILVDIVLFAQVLANLLENAIKYSPENTPIDIRAFVKDDNFYLEVLDRGIGIPDEELPFVFRNFYRASSSTGHKGTGLGLSICDGIIELHGGKIHAEVRAGGGTCIRICLKTNPENEKSSLG